MIDFSMNFANDVLISAGFSFFFESFFGHAGFVLGENGKYVYFHILHFKNFIPNLSLSKEKTPVACTPYLVTYLL